MCCGSLCFLNIFVYLHFPGREGMGIVFILRSPLFFFYGSFIFLHFAFSVCHFVAGCFNFPLSVGTAFLPFFLLSGTHRITQRFVMVRRWSYYDCIVHSNVAVLPAIVPTISIGYQELGFCGYSGCCGTARGVG